MLVSVVLLVLAQLWDSQVFAEPNSLAVHGGRDLSAMLPVIQGNDQYSAKSIVIKRSIITVTSTSTITDTSDCTCTKTAASLAQTSEIMTTTSITKTIPSATSTIDKPSLSKSRSSATTMNDQSTTTNWSVTMTGKVTASETPHLISSSMKSSSKSSTSFTATDPNVKTIQMTETALITALQTTTLKVILTDWEVTTVQKTDTIVRTVSQTTTLPVKVTDWETTLIEYTDGTYNLSFESTSTTALPEGSNSTFSEYIPFPSQTVTFTRSDTLNSITSETQQKSRLLTSVETATEENSSPLTTALSSISSTQNEVTIPTSGAQKDAITVTKWEYVTVQVSRTGFADSASTTPSVDVTPNSSHDITSIINEQLTKTDPILATPPVSSFTSLIDPSTTQASENTPDSSIRSTYSEELFFTSSKDVSESAYQASQATTASDFTISLCTSRVLNPTYTPMSLLPRDYTWGCPPRYLCQPSMKTTDGECNLEVGPPADTYYCRPEECDPSPPLLPPQFWSPSEVGHFDISQGYYNLNPVQFGLGYQIFDFPQDIYSVRRGWSINIPGKCYDECNNAMLEAESRGKTAELCGNDSAFLISHRACQACISSVNSTRHETRTLPQFQQFLFYCSGAQAELTTELASTVSSTPRINILTGFSSLTNPITTRSYGSTLLSSVISQSKVTDEALETASSSHRKNSTAKVVPSAYSSLPTSVFTGQSSVHRVFLPYWALSAMLIMMSPLNNW